MHVCIHILTDVCCGRCMTAQRAKSAAAARPTAVACSGPEQVREFVRR